MKAFEIPTVEVRRFSVEDVLTGSSPVTESSCRYLAPTNCLENIALPCDD